MNHRDAQGTVLILVIILLILCLWLHTCRTRIRGGDPTGVKAFYDPEKDEKLIKELIGRQAEAGTEIDSQTFGTSFRKNKEIIANVFIEFCYGKANELIKKDFERKRKEAFEFVFNFVLEHKRDSGMFIFRWNLNKSMPQFERVHDAYVAVGLSDSYGTIHVPKTQESFAIDEYITTENGIAVQIEYSEGGPSHKSNALEFYLRNRFATENPIESRASLDVLHTANSPFMTPYIKRNVTGVTDNDILIIRAFQNLKAGDELKIDFPDGLSFVDWKDNVITQYFCKANPYDFDDDELGFSNRAQLLLVNEDGVFKVKSQKINPVSSKRAPPSPTTSSANIESED